MVTARLNTTIKKKPLDLTKEQFDAERAKVNARLRSKGQIPRKVVQAPEVPKTPIADEYKVSQGPKPKSDVPLVKRDATGKLTGVTLPSGENYDNIRPEEVQKIIDNYNNERALPSGSEFADIAAQREASQATAKTLQEQTTTDVNATASDIVNTSLAPDPLLRDIRENLGQRSHVDELANKYLKAGLPSVALSLKVGNKLSSSVIKLLNRQSGGAGTPLFNELKASNPRIADYLSEYSNDDNFNSIKDELGRVYEDIGVSVDLAGDPVTAEVALDKYRKGVARLYLADSQLKFLYDNDPTISKVEIDKLRADIQAYLDGKLLDDRNNLRDNLLKSRTTSLGVNENGK